MIRLNLDFVDSNLQYPEDCERICKVALKHEYLISPIEANFFWEKYSNSMAASWLTLPDNDSDVWKSISDQIEKHND